VEDGANALNVSGGKGGSRGRKARAKGSDKWICFHCQKKCHFKRDCPELKDKNGSVHVVDGSSGDENYETAEALVVSSWESEESKSLDSGGSHDVLELWDVGVVSDQVEWFCKLQGGVHRGSTEFETLVEEFHLKVEDFQLEVEASDSDTRGGETTLFLAIKKEIGRRVVVLHRSGTTVKTLWGMFQLRLKKCKTY
jgi:hypothetical protein